MKKSAMFNRISSVDEEHEEEENFGVTGYKLGWLRVFGIDCIHLFF